MKMRTGIVLDDEPIARAMERAGVSSKKAAVEAALKACIRKPDYALLLAAEGSRLIADDYDPKAAAPSREPSAGKKGAQSSRRPRGTTTRQPALVPAGKKR